MSDQVLAQLIGDRGGYLNRLTKFVACPSVSADATLRSWLMQQLTALGFDKVRVLSAGGIRL